MITTPTTQISDHYPIYFDICILGKKSLSSSIEPNLDKPRYYEYRDFSSLKSPKFEEFISVECNKLSDYDVDTDSLAGSMVNLLSDGLEKFAPSVTRKSRLKKRGQFFYNTEIAEAKQVRRQLERNCKKHRREINRQLLNAT